jgi:hypothetical protein
LGGELTSELLVSDYLRRRNIHSSDFDSSVNSGLSRSPIHLDVWPNRGISLSALVRAAAPGFRGRHLFRLRPRHTDRRILRWLGRLGRLGMAPRLGQPHRDREQHLRHPLQLQYGAWECAWDCGVAHDAFPPARRTVCPTGVGPAVPGSRPRKPQDAAGPQLLSTFHRADGQPAGRAPQFQPEPQRIRRHQSGAVTRAHVDHG